jgi:hypothetical protein
MALGHLCFRYDEIAARRSTNVNISRPPFPPPFTYIVMVCQRLRSSAGLPGSINENVDIQTLWRVIMIEP